MSTGDEGFISRWSRRKIEARKDAPTAPQAEALPREPLASGEGALAIPDAAAEAESALPALESLTPESDFAPFMRGGVDPAVKGQALKTLFSDPALYPMDGLDVYIDDYSKPDPLPEGWLAKLQQFAFLHEQPAPVVPPAEESAAPAAEIAAPAVAESTSEGALPQPVQAPDAPSGAPAEEDASDTSRDARAQPDANNRGTI